MYKPMPHIIDNFKFINKYLMLQVIEEPLIQCFLCFDNTDSTFKVTGGLICKILPSAVYVARGLSETFT